MTLPDLGGLSQLANGLPDILATIDKLFYFGICMSLGGLAMKGWKAEKNWALNVIGSISFGVLCIIGGVLLSQVIPVQLPFLEGILQSLLTAAVIYTILNLLTSNGKPLSKVGKQEFINAQNKIRELTHELMNLKNLLMRKKVLPDKLSPKELDKELKEGLAEKKISTYEKISSQESEYETEVIIRTPDKKKYLTIINNYTGQILSITPKGINYKKILSKPKVIIGLTITTIFVALLLSQASEQALNKINDRLSITTLGSPSLSQQEINHTIINQTCNNAEDLLYRISINDFNKITLNAQPPSALTNKLPNQNIMEGISADNYYLAILTTLSEQEFMTALQTYLLSNPMTLLQGGINICQATHEGRTIDNHLTICSTLNNNVCECKQLSQVNQYCSVISENINQKLQEQMSEIIK